MSQPTPERDALDPADAELLELYLDGQLAGERAVEAEARIAKVAAMQQAATRQQLIDQSLKRQFQPPPLNEHFLEWLRSAGESDVAPAQRHEPAGERHKVVPRSVDDRRQQRTRFLAIAASIACVVAWSTFGWNYFSQTKSPDRYALRPVDAVYQASVDSGFKPDWLCEDDQEFAQTFANRQGQGLLLKPLPEGIHMAGLAYLRSLTRQSTSMMAYVDEQPVLVIVGRKDSISDDALDATVDGISIFTRQLGDLLAVEVSPLEEPRLLNYLYLAEVPDEPTGHIPGEPLP